MRFPDALPLEWFGICHEYPKFTPGFPWHDPAGLETINVTIILDGKVGHPSFPTTSLPGMVANKQLSLLLVSS